MSEFSDGLADDGAQRQPYATMVTNFDSTEQRRIWKLLLDEAQGAENESAAEQRRPATEFPNITDLWAENRTQHTCDKLLNENVSFATYFAGVIRTAYLYCPQIMLTVPEVCDGLFFLSLGPAKVNAMLGKSYKDGPSILISGQYESFEECLFHFTFATVHAVREDAVKKGVVLDDTARRCAATDEQYTIRPLEYCVLDASVSHTEALSRPSRFYEKLTEQVETWKNGSMRLDDVLKEAFADFLGVTDDRFACLAKRWREWVDAVSQGTVVYENQRSEEVSARADGRRAGEFRGEDFAGIFSKHVEKNTKTLLRHFANTYSGAEADKAKTVLRKIAGMGKRSDAFACIEDAFPEDDRRSGTGAFVEPEDGRPSFHAMLRDWYQFVYQRTLATYLGACLIAVSASSNSYERIAGMSMADSLKADGDVWHRMRNGVRRFFGIGSTSSALMLSGSITEVLGGMPYHVFSCFCYQARTSIRRWRECTPDTPARVQRLCTKNIAYIAQKASEENSLFEDAKGMKAKTVLAAVLSAISALCDQVWFNGNSVPIWIVVVTAWLISMAPDVIELGAWLREIHSTSKTVVFMGD